MTSLDIFAVAFMATLSTPAALCLVQKVVVGDTVSTLNPEPTTTHRNIFVLVIVVLYRAMVKTSVPVADPTLEIPLPRRRRPRKAFGPKGRRVLAPTERKLLVIVLVVFLVEERRHERAVSSQKLLEGPRQPKLLGWDPSVSAEAEAEAEGLSAADKLLEALYALQEELEAERPLVLRYRKPRVDRDPGKDLRFSHGVERRTSNRLFKATWL